MEAFLAFKYVHVAAMFFAIALALSTEQVVRRVAGSRDPRSIETAVIRSEPLTKLSDALFGIGIVAGIIAALTGNMNLLAPWLVLSYVAVAAAFGVGMLVIAPWSKRLHAAAAASPDGAASVELQAVIDDGRARAGSWALVGLIALLVFLMVVQPLG
jgi:hypothetical protein